MTSHDVVIVGAGTAGLSLAYLLASKDVDVAVIDIKPKNLIGDKICGDAIAGHHYVETGLPRPEDDAIRIKVDGIYLYGRSLDYKVKIVSSYGGYVVDRHKYGQQLLRKVLDKGATLYDGYLAQDLIIEDDYAKGVKIKKQGLDVIKEVRGKIIVDASGYTASLLMRTPDKWMIEKEIEKRDIIPAYREVVKLEKPIWDPENLHLHFYSKYAPGGYVWLFPWSEDGYYLNFGNGIIGGVKLPKPKTLLYRYAEDVLPDLLRNRKVIKGGQWVIPNRRPRHIFVGNGFLAVGDAAIMIDPATAEGIGYGMYGAYQASRVILESLEASDYSREYLWKYQKAYMSGPYGLRQARLDVFRILLQAHSDLDIEFVVKTKLLTSEELARARDEDDFMSSFSKFIKASKTILYGKHKLLRNLIYAINKMKEVKRLYLAYPEAPDKVGEWIKKEEALFREVKNRLGIYIPPEVRGMG